MMKGNNGATFGCEWIKTHLDAYLDGELNTEQSAAVKAHLDGCPDCAAEYRQAQELLDLVAAADDVVPDPLVHDAIMRVVAEEPRLARKNRAVMWRRLSASLAGVCLLLALLIIPPALRKHQAPTPEAPNQDDATKDPENEDQAPPAEDPGGYDEPSEDTPENDDPGCDDPELDAPGSERPGQDGPSADCPSEGIAHVVLYRQTPAPEESATLWEFLSGDWKGETAALSISAEDNTVYYSDEEGEILAPAILVDDLLILHPDTDDMIRFSVRLEGDALWLTKIP